MFICTCSRNLPMHVCLGNEEFISVSHWKLIEKFNIITVEQTYYSTLQEEINIK